MARFFRAYPGKHVLFRNVRVGVLNTQTLPVTSTTTGALTIQTQLHYAGTVTTTSATANRVARALPDAVATMGTLTRTVGSHYAGTVTTASALLRALSTHVTGTSTTTGVLGRAASRAYQPTVTTSGALSRFGKPLYLATANTAGRQQVAASVHYPVTVTLTPLFPRLFSAAYRVTSTTAASLLRAFVHGFTAITVTLTPTSTNKAQKPLNSAVSTFAMLARIPGLRMPAISGLFAMVRRAVSTSEPATVTTTATVALPRQLIRALPGAVTLTASLSRSVSAARQVTMSLFASVTRRIGQLEPTVTVGLFPTVTRVVGQRFSGVATLIGSARRAISTAVATTVATAATATNRTQRVLATTVSLIGRLGRAMSTTYPTTATLAPTVTRMVGARGTTTVTTASAVALRPGIVLRPVVTLSLALSRNVRSLYLVTAATTVHIGRALSQTFSGVLTMTATRVGRLTHSFPAATVTVTVSLNNTYQLIGRTVITTAPAVVLTVFRAVADVVWRWGRARRPWTFGQITRD